MSTDIALLQHAANKYKIPQVIVSYLILQQTKKNDFFKLLLQKKINGRLFYNTCLPDGTKEIRFGNEDFLNSDFKLAVEQLLMPFQHLTLAQVTSESVQASAISATMHEVISLLMSCIESSNEWKHFWEHDISLHADNCQKKQLYNLIAGAAAYKALVSCVDQSEQIQDPMVKRNIAKLISICTSKYESKALTSSQEFAMASDPALGIKAKDQAAMGDLTYTRA